MKSKLNTLKPITTEKLNEFFKIFYFFMSCFHNKTEMIIGTSRSYSVYLHNSIS